MAGNKSVNKARGRDEKHQNIAYVKLNQNIHSCKMNLNSFTRFSISYVITNTLHYFAFFLFGFQDI